MGTLLSKNLETTIALTISLSFLRRRLSLRSNTPFRFLTSSLRSMLWNGNAETIYIVQTAMPLTDKSRALANY